MKKILLILTSLFLLFSYGCKEEEGPTGSIFVQVNSNWSQVEGATITTEPPTKTAVTDLTGSAILSGIPVGGYKVNATHPNIGSGSNSASVIADEAANVEVFLIAGVFIQPSVNIELPLDNAIYGLSQEVSFYAIVGDEEDPPQNLNIQWTSSLDGALSLENANASGVTEFTKSNLSEGDHVITLSVTNSDGLIGSNSVNISVKNLPDAVVLEPIENMSSELTLNWSTSTENEFSAYKVTRAENASGPFEVIDIINDINQTSFSDNNVSFGANYYYQIIVQLTSLEESYSNVEFVVFEGEHIDLGTGIVRMILDKERPYIYAVDQVNNSLLFINKETKELEKTIFVGSSPSDLDINLDNDKMYIANFGSSQISVIDLDTQEKIEDIIVNVSGGWDGNPYRLACLAGDRLVYTSEDQWCDLKLVDANTGTLLSNSGSIYQPGLNTNEDQTVLFVSESGSSGSAVLRYNLEGDNLVSIQEASSGGNSRRDSPISGNGEFLFFRRNKLLTNNLQSNLGTFNEHIYACNYDGTIVVGSEYIWNGETFAIIKPMPLNSEIMLIDEDGLLYAYDANSSKIAIINLD